MVLYVSFRRSIRLQVPPPNIPKRLEHYYINKIREALIPTEQVKVETLIDDMIQECLYTREFVEYFGHSLADLRRKDIHERLKADTYWKLCLDRVSEAV